MGALLWALVFGAVVPLVTVIIVRWHAKPHVKAIVNAAIAGGVGAITGGLSSNTLDGSHWQLTVASAFAAWATSVVFYVGIWSPTGTADKLAKATQSFGLAKLPLIDKGTPDLFFADLSNFNDPVDLNAYRASYSVVAEQVNWGTLITDPNGRMNQIRSLKFDLVIWYMGLVATEDITAQVNTFINTLGALLPNETIVIDWEATGNTTPTAAQRDQAAGLLAAHYTLARWWIGTYGPAGMLGQFPPASWVWAASYETTEPTIAHVMWQFTNGVFVSIPYGPINFPGVGDCDASVFHGTVAQLIAAVCPAAPAPPPPVIEPMEDAMLARYIWTPTEGPQAGVELELLAEISPNPFDATGKTGVMWIKWGPRDSVFQSFGNVAANGSYLYPQTVNIWETKNGGQLKFGGMQAPGGTVRAVVIDGTVEADGKTFVLNQADAP